MMETGGIFRANGRRELTHGHGLTASKEASSPRPDLWNGGLVCAFEFVRGSSEARPAACKHHHGHGHGKASSAEKESYWAPIGWRRIAELVETTVDGGGAQAAWGDGQGQGQGQGQMMSLMDGAGGHCCDADSITVADVVAPCPQRPAGPTWWCHVTAGHPGVDAWLAEARWLHPAICVALRDETMLISEKMKHLLYEFFLITVYSPFLGIAAYKLSVEFQVPVRVAGGLLFELLGQSVGDPGNDEDDIPIVLRAWQAQNFLITALHVKGSAPNINVIGITEVQELLSACGSTAPKCINEVIAHLASRLARWDDRLWRKYVFGVADEIELKFVNRRNQEDLNLLCIIFNQDIRRLATQVIRVKWSLHAREEIIFELLKYLRGSTTKSLLEAIRKDTRQMIEEQEAVRGRLFTIQDVMQSTVRAWLQDRSLRITHNLTIFGGCGLILSIITGLFGINVDGIPGAENTPYAFALFSGLLFLIGFLLIIAGIIYFGLEKPISDEQVEVKKLELQEIVSMFQHEAQRHAKVREGVLRSDLPPRAADLVYDKVRKLGRYISFHANREPSLQDEEISC